MPTDVISLNTVAQNASADNLYSGQRAAEIRENTPTTNYQNGSIDIYQSGGAGYDNRFLIDFTGLSNISGPVTVSSASIFLYALNTIPSDIELTAERILQDWVTTEATWNEYSTGNGWTTGGASSDGNDISTTNAGTAQTGTAAGYKEITGLAAIVQGWINGDFANHGVIIRALDQDFDAMETQTGITGGTDGQEPELVVTYTVSGGGGGASLAQQTAVIEHVRNLHGR